MQDCSEVHDTIHLYAQHASVPISSCLTLLFGIINSVASEKTCCPYWPEIEIVNAASNALRYLMRKASIPDFQPSRLFLYWYTRMAVMPSELHSPPPDVHEDAGAFVHSACAAISVYHCCPEALWPYNDSADGIFSQEPNAQVSTSMHSALWHLH